MNLFTKEELEDLMEATEKLKEQMMFERMQAIENIYVLEASDRSVSFEGNVEIENIYSLIENFYDMLILSFTDIIHYIKTGSTFDKIDIRALTYYNRSYTQKLMLIFIKNNLLKDVNFNIRMYINDDYTINNKLYYSMRKDLLNIARKTNPFMDTKKNKKKEKQQRRNRIYLNNKGYHSVY